MDLLLTIQRTSKDWGEDFFFQTPDLLSPEASSQNRLKLNTWALLYALVERIIAFFFFAACDEFIY